MPVCNLNLQYLFCHKNIVKHLLEAGLNADDAIKKDAVWTFGLRTIPESVDVVVGKSENIQSLRYLDQFHLIVPCENISERQDVFDEFFEIIAEDYEKFIDITRNCDNINVLLSLLKNRIKYPKDSTLLDYGCGIGLSVESNLDAEWNIIGFDRCKVMLQLAKKRGMLVWSQNELASQPDNSIDGVFASYVLHYLLPNNRELKLLWQKMKAGSTLVANLHKNQGVDILESTMQKLNGSFEILPNPAKTESHGIYVACTK